MRMPGCTLGAPLLAFALLQGCATVRTTIPPDDYRTLKKSRAYTVVTNDATTHKARRVEPNDSTLVLVLPDNGRDSGFPVTIRYGDIRSITTSRRESIVHIQAGLVVGTNLGDDSKDYSSVRGVAELGYVDGELAPVKPRYGFGATGYLSMAEDIRVGLKAIMRRRYSGGSSLDVSAGPMITYESDGTFDGFIGGVALNAGFLTFRSEYMSYPFDAWSSAVDHPAGREEIWSNGITFNGTSGWVAIVVGMAGLILIGASAGG